jgi:phosphatidylinositol alpha-1,6-mannosyltransferase
LAISNYTADLLNRAGAKNNVEVIGCGISSSDYENQKENFPSFSLQQKHLLKKKAGLPTNKIVIGTMCRLVASKNVDMLIRAVADSEHLVGVVIGDGPEKLNLSKLADSLGVADKIRWFSHVQESKKWEILAALDAFCLLSKETANGQVEGFGLVLLEAACAATPVIATISGGMTDVVKTEVTGLTIEVGDVEGLVNAAHRYLMDPGLASSMVEGSRRQIEERFNWETIAEKLTKRWNQEATV